MAKSCEFCGAPRPVVYCQADAAYLCLSCDAKVHSANALSGRHSRNLLCDSCRQNPAFVRCLDHSMLLCCGCESRLHESFTQHKRLRLKSFTGCPSAKHFAALWGLNVNEQAQFSARIDHFGSGSCVSYNDQPGCSVELINCLGSQEPELSFTSLQHNKILDNHQQEQNNFSLSVMQQILDLKNLQLSDQVGTGNQSPLLHHDENKEANDLHSFDKSSQGLKDDRFPSPISQLDPLSCFSSVGDAFWQYKSPLDSSQVHELQHDFYAFFLKKISVLLKKGCGTVLQFWSQNLQDLGVCEDLGRFDDDFDNMPDVDATFRNFEDLFTSDIDVTRPLLEDDLMWSDIEKETSIEKSGNSHTKITENLSAASSISISKNISSIKEYPSEHTSNRLSRSMEYSSHLKMRSSFPRSRLSAESSGSDCLDSGHSGNVTEVEGGENSTKTSNDRKKARLHGKQSQLAPRKGKTERHKRIKGQSVNVEGYESDTVNVTKSY